MTGNPIARQSTGNRIVEVFLTTLASSAGNSLFPNSFDAKPHGTLDGSHFGAG
jgi:hypothetical protein